MEVGIDSSWRAPKWKDYSGPINARAKDRRKRTSMIDVAVQSYVGTRKRTPRKSSIVSAASEKLRANWFVQDATLYPPTRDSCISGAHQPARDSPRYRVNSYETLAQTLSRPPFLKNMEHWATVRPPNWTCGLSMNFFQSPPQCNPCFAAAAPMRMNPLLSFH